MALLWDWDEITRRSRGDLLKRDLRKEWDNEVFTLGYCGVMFEAYLKDTHLFEDPLCITKEELDLLKVIDESLWIKIRYSWSKAWMEKKAHEAFEEGYFEE